MKFRYCLINRKSPEEVIGFEISDSDKIFYIESVDICTNLMNNYNCQEERGKTIDNSQ